MKTRNPKRIDIEAEELEAALERGRSAPLSDEDYHRLRAALSTLIFLSQQIANARTTIRKLRKILFGSKSEKSAQVLAGQNPSENESEQAGSSSEPDSDPDSKTPSASAEGESAKDRGEDGKREDGGDAGKGRGGHGRNGAAKYVGAEVINVSHESLRHGDPCPVPPCSGRVYEQATPAVLVNVLGAAPLSARVIWRERLRCNLCLAVFTAKLPAGVRREKYAPSAIAMMAILRYGSGLPLYRLAVLQKSLGIPLSASTQWHVVSKAAPRFAPVYAELVRQAAQGGVIHNDDTTMRVLELLKENRKRRELGETATRTGIFTSGIVSVREGVRIALFFTGREHAGENLEKVLRERSGELSAPIQMCDALSSNVSGDFETIVANCLVHARRNYVEVLEDFPEECGFVIETLRGVFHNEARARRDGLGPQARLELHRRESFRPMATLRHWMREQIAKRRVEPNSGLGKAIKYMRKYWRKLTRFLFIPGAPLENNVVERALKRAICHRKNSLFYKTRNGALVGDLYMSLIATSELAGANPFEYLGAVHSHEKDVAERPAEWLPWNYRKRLEALATKVGRPAAPG